MKKKPYTKRSRRLCGFLSAVLLFGGLSAGCIPGLSPGKSAALPLDGVWYEQEENGGTLTVKGSQMTYVHNDYSTRTGFTVGKTTEEGTELLPDEEFWYYIDIFYHADEETITAHDLPHTDGDGGYHLHTFQRTEYVPPPEPVYGDRIDKSDPDAQKEFSESAISSLSFSVVEPIRDNGDMAYEQPEAGSYQYELTVEEDGSGVLSSNFCQDISVSAEQLEGLAELFRTSDIPSLNGVDVYTEEMPEDTQYYDLSIGFANGEQFHSSANGKDVSAAWYVDGYRFHQYLFDLFCEAGYNVSTGEFHSSGPMKRIGFAEGESAAYSIITELEREELVGTAYDYDVYCEYPVFKAEGDAPDALMKTLSALSEQYKKQAEADLAENDADMASAPKAVWMAADHRYAYSFYSPTFEKVWKGMFTFMVSEGHSNSLGLGKYGSGYYPYWRFCIDDETGKILCLNDVFNDTNGLLEAVTDALCAEYPYDEYISVFTSEDYQKRLRTALLCTEAEGGIGFLPEADGLKLNFPKELSKDRDYSISMKLYYDAVQDLLNDRYCSVRKS